jgi:hypothetical protein
MSRTGVWEHNMIKMTIRELYYTLANFLTKWNFSQGFLFMILILQKGTAKLQWGGRGDIFFRVQHSSIRVQSSSVGCSIAQKGKAYVAHKGVA